MTPGGNLLDELPTESVPVRMIAAFGQNDYPAMPTPEPARLRPLAASPCCLSRWTAAERSCYASTTASIRTATRQLSDHSNHKKTTNRWEEHDDKPVGKQMVPARNDERKRQLRPEPTNTNPHPSPHRPPAK